MRFMVLVKASSDSEAGIMPTREELAAMGDFNEEMAKAGVVLAGEGLHPSSKGSRIRFSKAGRSVTDGPFPETKELLAGFWIIQAKSRDEAMQWMLRAPFQDGEIEVRQIFETEEFPADVLPPDEAARENTLRAELQRKAGAR